MEIPHVSELPDGWVPVETVAIFECIDEDGDMSMSVRYSEEITYWKAIGMLQAALDGMRQKLREETEEG